jgi:hypothetical protein
MMGAALALAINLPSISLAQTAKTTSPAEKPAQSTNGAQTAAPKPGSAPAATPKAPPATPAVKPTADAKPAIESAAAGSKSAANDSAPRATPAAKPAPATATAAAKPAPLKDKTATKVASAQKPAPVKDEPATDTAKLDAPTTAGAAELAAASDGTSAVKPRLLMSAAAHYADLQAELSRIRDKPLTDAKSVENALNTFGAQNPGQLTSGWLAYSAMLASRNPEFIKSVKDAEAFYKHDEFVKILQDNPGYARTLAGGEQALQQALAANTKDSVRFTNAAQYVADQSRKLSSVAWGKKAVANRDATAMNLAAGARKVHPATDAAQKLLAANDIDTMLASATSDQPTSVWDKVSLLAISAPVSAISALAPGSSAANTAYKVKPARYETANKIVQIAALHIIDADVQNQTVVERALLDKASVSCIEAAQLQIQACVSTAGTPAAQSFCLARHGIGVVKENQQSIGRCLGDVAE